MGEGSVLGDREACGIAVTLGGGKGKPQTCPGGIREGYSEKAARPIAKLWEITGGVRNRDTVQKV